MTIVSIPLSSDLYFVIKKIPLMVEIKIKELMTPNPVTLTTEDVVSDVADIFHSGSFHHIPVLGKNKQLEGMVSRTDFERIKLGASIFKRPDSEDYNKALFRSTMVCDIMTKNIVVLNPEDGIEKAYQIFTYNKFRALPICDGDKLVGIITPLDILAYFFTK